MSWQPSCTLDTLKARAHALHDIRSFFMERGYLEVETPIMSRYGVTDVHLSNISAACREQKAYLQTSPEYFMKRLLVAGSGSIFQMARVFRDDELGRWHNPEFTLLEWYRLDVCHHTLMNECESLLQRVLKCPPLIKMTYQEAFERYAGCCPFDSNIRVFKQILAHHHLDNVLPQTETDVDAYLFLLMSHVVEPKLATLGAPVAVYGFPASQAALARLHEGRAERFEIYYQGLELANGFHELTDVAEQQQRFLTDKRKREQHGFKDMAIDPHFITALEHGLPACSGVALGVDRLLALLLSKSSIAEVMAFDFSRV